MLTVPQPVHDDVWTSRTSVLSTEQYQGTRAQLETGVPTLLFSGTKTGQLVPSQTSSIHFSQSEGVLATV